MADFEDDDFDIDELLDEIDSSGKKGKSQPTEAAPSATASDLDKKTPSGGGASSKSVRFSGAGDADDGDDFVSKLPRSQREPPNTSLRTMFMTDNPQNTNTTTSAATGLANKPPTGRSSRSSAASAAGANSKDDWLGIQDGKRSLSPSSSPPPTQRNRPQPGLPSTPSVDQKSTGNSSDEEDALFKDIGISRQTTSSGGPPRRSAMKPATPQSPSSDPAPFKPMASQQRRSGGVANLTPPGSGGSGPTMPPPKAPFSSSILDQLGMSPSPSGGSPKHSLDMNKPPPKHQPLPSSTDLLGTGPTFPFTPQSPFTPPQSAKAMDQSQNIIPPRIPSGDVFPSFSLAGPPQLPVPPEQSSPVVPPTKKKLLKKDGGGGNVASSASTSTLQLPTHLINEDELKAMSSSLKTLYANQLDMLEKSYKEQMEFLSEANRRKEDILKEEMKAMQMDYEERLDRLRNEIREVESKQPQKEKDIVALAHISEELRTALTNLNTLLEATRQNSRTSGADGAQIESILQEIVKENLVKNWDKFETMEGNVCGTLKSVDESVSRRFTLMSDAWRNLISQIKQNMNEVVDVTRTSRQHESQLTAMDLAKLEQKMERSMEELQKIARNASNRKEDSSPKILAQLDESVKTLLVELAKVQKLQRKTKETTDTITMEPLVKILESDRDEEQRRRERLTVQLKEMRRDVKRILLEQESRLESSSKFNVSTEMELKSISQSIRDLNSQLKFSLISGPGHPENLTNQFTSSMQQTQAEMEMKLLREERQALSDSMAQINVEKRKTSEEKVELEKQKFDFEKERDQLRNLELTLKTRLSETEEIQKKTESVRREEIQLTSEAQMKLKELDNEKSGLRSKLMEAEQRLRTWENKLRQEKVELLHEREFMERLRDQLLCPGCMKHNKAAGVIHPPPPPYIPTVPMESASGTTILRSPRGPVISIADEYFNSRLSGGSGDAGDLYDMYYRRLFDQ